MQARFIKRGIRQMQRRRIGCTRLRGEAGSRIAPNVRRSVFTTVLFLEHVDAIVWTSMVSSCGCLRWAPRASDARLSIWSPAYEELDHNASIAIPSPCPETPPTHLLHLARIAVVPHFRLSAFHNEAST